jgi:hypothetical protein
MKVYTEVQQTRYAHYQINLQHFLNMQKNLLKRILKIFQKFIII